MYDGMQSELHRLDQEREAMDRSIQELDATKRALKLQLEGVSAGLQATQADQRAHMQQCDDEHAKVNAIESEFRSKVRSEDAIILEAQKHMSSVDRTAHLVGE